MSLICKASVDNNNNNNNNNNKNNKSNSLIHEVIMNKTGAKDTKYLRCNGLSSQKHLKQFAKLQEDSEYKRKECRSK